MIGARFLGVLAMCAGLSALVVLPGCGSSQPPVGHRTAGLKHALNADTAYRLGRFGTSAQRYRQALTHLRAADDQPAVARALHNLGMSLKAQGRCRDAIDRLTESAELHRRLKMPTERALNLLGVGECRHEMGEHAGARASLGEAHTWAKKASNEALMARALAGVGASWAAAGDHGRAATYYSRAAKLAAKGDDPGAVALVQHNQGRVAARRNDHAKATALFLQAADGFRKVRDGDGLAHALASAAGSMEAQGGGGEEAAVLYQRAAYAATSVKRYRRAAEHFADAARLFAGAGKQALANECREGGRRVLDAWEREHAAGNRAAGGVR